MSSVPERPKNRGRGDAETRRLVAEQIDRLAALLHYADVVPEGSSATFDIGLDCGFAGTVVVRVDAIGDCERPVAATRPRRARPATRGAGAES
jgi:hypothetical protein